MAAYDAKHNPQETPLGNWTFIKCSVTHLSKSLIKLIAKKIVIWDFEDEILRRI